MSAPLSVRFPKDLAAAAEIRARRLGYKSRSDYMKGLARYDLLVQGKHTVTLPWSQKPLAEQDEIDAHLLRLTERGEGERGQLLEHIVERILRHVQDPERLAELLASRLADAAKVKGA